MDGPRKTSFLPNRLLKEEISSLDRCLDNPHLHELTDGTEVDLKFGYKLLEIIERFRKDHIENFTI